MSLGKIKMKVVFFGKKFTFYEYARHTLASSSRDVESTMNQLKSSEITSHIIYFKTKNFYIQLLAAYSASYYYYLFFARIVPLALLEEGLKELVRGRDIGIRAWTFDNNKIEEELVQKYEICFKRYYQGIMTDCNNIMEGSYNADAFNPDINEFTKRFVEDSIHLMEAESNVSINEVERTLFSHIIADIPTSVFKELSERSMEYIR